MPEQICRLNQEGRFVVNVVQVSIPSYYHFIFTRSSEPGKFTGPSDGLLP